MKNTQDKNTVLIKQIRLEQIDDKIHSKHKRVDDIYNDIGIKNSIRIPFTRISIVKDIKELRQQLIDYNYLQQDIIDLYEERRKIEKITTKNIFK